MNMSKLVTNIASLFFFYVIGILKSKAEIYKVYRQRFKEKNNDEYLSIEKVLRCGTTLFVTNLSYISLFVFLIEFCDITMNG